MSEIYHPVWDKVTTPSAFKSITEPGSERLPFTEVYAPAKANMNVTAHYKDNLIGLKIVEVITETEFVAQITSFSPPAENFEDLSIGQRVRIDRCEISGLDLGQKGRLTIGTTAFTVSLSPVEQMKKVRAVSDEYRAEGKAYAKFLATLSPEEIAHGNEINHRNTQEEFNQFIMHFKAGSCYLCEKPLSSFSKKIPCPHWLLKPKGFKKHDLAAIAEKYGFYQMQAFLRWIANQEAFAKNINDLAEEGSGDKMFEVTIKYKYLEWAFSCAESDYQGHATSQHAKHPHYHFQMRIDGRPFINYSDNHLPFSKMDIVNIEAMKAQPDKIKQRFSHGEGMNDILSDETVERIINLTVPRDAEEGAPFKIDTFAMAEEGKTINSDDVYAIMQESKEKGVTVASLMHKLPNAQTRIIVSPGPGVVEQAPRTGRKI